MYNFSEYVLLREDDEPAPPGVDPEMWANTRWRDFWYQSPEGRAYLAQKGQQQPVLQTRSPSTAVVPQQRVARALGPTLPDPATLSKNHNLVAKSLSLAMSPAGAMTYPYYWSDKENRAKRNPYYKG